jgi:excisionase family DNA binding protein
MTEIKLYSLKELATLLSVTERTLHNYIKSGKMKGQKIGRAG